MINSVLSDVEISEQFSFYYIGENIQCTLDEISEKMPGAYEKVFQNIDANKLPQHDGYVCITHSCDLNTKHINLTAGVYFKQNPNSAQAQFVPTHQSLKLTHKGSYRYLRTAWSKIITYQRGNKIKTNSKIPMFEFYLNNPHEVAEKDYLTEIHIALKH
jgi:effector-binding domain-containing protein